MARVNNLSDFLTDVADAIRTKKETTEQIPAANFDTEILDITTGVMTQTQYDNAMNITNEIQTGSYQPHICPKFSPPYVLFQDYKGSDLDLTNLDTSNMTNMAEMFSRCSGLSVMDLSNFNTSEVTLMNHMFAQCTGLTTLNLSSFDTNKVTNMQYMFVNCNKLTELDISNFDFSNVTTYNSMFEKIPTDCKILVKDQTAKNWVLARRSDLTNVQIKEVLNI